MKTEIAKADVAELKQLFDSVEAKQYKRPDMNGDLRLGSPRTTSQTTSTCGTHGSRRDADHGLRGAEGRRGPAGAGAPAARAGQVGRQGAEQPAAGRQNTGGRRSTAWW